MENLNNVPSSGTYGGAINEVNHNFSLVKGAIDGLEGRTIRSKGLFPTLAALNAAYPSPIVGDYAYVGSGLPAEIYDCVTAGTWHDTGQTGGSETINLGDYSTTTQMNAAIDSGLQGQVGYAVCSTDGATARKDVVVSGFKLLANGGALHIKMTTANTNASATMNISPTSTIVSANTKPLFYNGEQATASNTWEANEILSIYYDGNNYQATNAKGGGGKAEKIKYDNTESGLIAINVQDAIDELASNIVDINGIDYTQQVVFSSNNMVIRLSDGLEYSNNYMKATDYIIIPENVKAIACTLPVVLNNTNPFGLVFFDDCKQLIANTGLSVHIGSDRNAFVALSYIPQGARCIKTTYWNDSSISTYNLPAFKFYFFYDTDKLSKLLSNKVNLDNKYPIALFFINGYSIRYTGATRENSYMMASESFAIPDSFNLLTVKMPIVLSMASNNAQGLCFYNSLGVVVSFFPMKVGSERGSEYRYFVIPENAASFRTTYWNANSVQTYGLDNFSAWFGVYGKVDLAKTIQWVEGNAMIIADNGEVSNNTSGFKATDFISLERCVAFSVRMPIAISNIQNAGMAFYDKDKQFISGSGIVIKTGETRECEVLNPEIPSNAKYFRTTYWLDSYVETYNLDTFMCILLVDNNIDQQLMELQKEIKKIPSNIITDKDKEPKFTLFGDCGIYKSDEALYVPQPNDTSQSVFDMYDAIMANHLDRMQKVDLGLASDGIHHLYAYEINPMLPSLRYRDDRGTYYNLNWIEYPQETVVLTSGVHGNEKGAVAALYNVVEQMLGENANDETNFILNNVYLCIVPIVNPYGFDENIRYNYNNVDINNDYGVFEQAESTAIRDYVGSKTNVAVFVDCHTCNTRPSIWAEAENEAAKNLSFSIYGGLLKNWIMLNSIVTQRLPMFQHNLNGWRGVASNYFFKQGIIAFTAETVHSFQTNIVENRAINPATPDETSVRMGMDIFTNAVIHCMKVASKSTKFYKGGEDFKIYDAPESITILSGETSQLLALATGFELNYRWSYSDNGGTTWRPLNDNGMQIGSPLLYIPYTSAVNGRLLRCLISDTDGHSGYFGNTRIIKQ